MTPASILAILVATSAPVAQHYTANELMYMPVLKQEIERNWPEATSKAHFPAQVMQETCPSLKSQKCWSPHAELKTSREYGFGLGQITITKRFDNFKEAKKLDKSMSGWRWENRYNAAFQLRTLVLTDRMNYGKCAWAETDRDRWAFALSSYNGGYGGVLSDRAVCRSVVGCKQNRWFDNVENTSKKSKVAANGYGQGFFQVNRNYVKNIMGVRSSRYESYFGR